MHYDDKHNNYFSPVGIFLSKLGVEFEEFLLEKSAHSVLDVCRILNCQTNQVIKSILLKGKKKSYLVNTIGSKKIDLDLMSTQVRDELQLAKPNHVTQITGYKIGSVSPYLSNENSKTTNYADNDILKQGFIIIGSGNPKALIKLSVKEFEKTFNGQYLNS